MVTPKDSFDSNVGVQKGTVVVLQSFKSIYGVDNYVSAKDAVPGQTLYQLFGSPLADTMYSPGNTGVYGKRLTNTPGRQAGSVLKCPDDRKNRVVSAQTTYTGGSSAVGGRVCEQRYAAERILPESRFELQHTGSPSKETALEEKA